MKKNDTKKAQSAAALLERIEKFTKPQRIGIYAGTLVLMLGLAAWLLFWPKYEKINSLDKQLDQLKVELAKAQKNALELNDWRSRMKKKEAEYKTVMRALPEKEEIPSLLAGISQAGKDAGLEFLLFQPKPESVKEFYAEIPVDINVSGSYHQVAAFFDKVSNLPRIVNIRDMKMTPQSRSDGAGELKTACQAVTYKFVETPPQSAAAGKGRGKRK
jgi:type IV pilus assembly protein PilO